MNPFPTYTEACTAVCASKQLEVPGSLRFATHNILWYSNLRGVAQSGSAPALGAGGPRFKSGRPD